jgi:tellurite resistance protein TerC
VSIGTPVLWISFNLFVLALLALDLGVFNRKAHVISTREAAIWSAIWIGLALAFNVVVYVWQGSEVALQFLTGYLIEKSLSVDNIFVFVLLFASFGVPAAYQHRVLFWGVLGALVMRGALIFLGSALIATFSWVLYIFGAFLIITGIRMALPGEREMHPERNPVVRTARRFFPVTEGYEGTRFFVRRQGQTYITSLLIALVLIETTDLIFALDSIPAIFAITLDPFIIYTSNVFAILGLRSLYFLLAGAVRRFHYLKYGLAAVLVLVGVKMLIADLYHLPIALSLGLIALFLGSAVIASLVRSPQDKSRDEVSPEASPEVSPEVSHGAREPGAQKEPGERADEGRAHEPFPRER